MTSYPYGSNATTTDKTAALIGGKLVPRVPEART